MHADPLRGSDADAGVGADAGAPEASRARDFPQ